LGQFSVILSTRCYAVDTGLGHCHLCPPIKNYQCGMPSVPNILCFSYDAVGLWQQNHSRRVSRLSVDNW